MNKHEEARKELRFVDVVSSNNILSLYINECEVTEKAYEELKRDVKRYNDIRTSCPKGMSIDDWKEEREALEIRLAKVGKEE